MAEKEIQENLPETSTSSIERNTKIIPSTGIDALDNLQEKFSAYSKYIFGGVALLALIGVGYWWFSNQKAKKHIEASNLMWKVERNFENNEFELANTGGKDKNGYPQQGLTSIAQEYSGTKAGELARYREGVGYLNMGNFDAAIASLSQVNFDDEILGAVAKGALGDAYYEKGVANKAIEYYKKAVNHSDNEFTTPIYLKKLALVQADAGQTEDAIKTYTKLKEKYSTSQEGINADKYIAKLSAK